MERKDFYRKKVIEEIIVTERTYTNELGLFVKVL
jgi:hypothetical protein